MMDEVVIEDDESDTEDMLAAAAGLLAGYMDDPLTEDEQKYLKGFCDPDNPCPVRSIIKYTG
jgi:hypothetical protein